MKSIDHEKTIDKKREIIARRAAKEIKNGMYVNLGIGIPMLIPNFLDQNIQTCFHSENGILGLGPYPETKKDTDSQLINAGNVIFC